MVSKVMSFVLSFFPRGVLDEILNLIESVSEGFPSYFCVPVFDETTQKSIYTLLTGALYICLPFFIKKNIFFLLRPHLLLYKDYYYS